MELLPEVDQACGRNSGRITKLVALCFVEGETEVLHLAHSYARESVAKLRLGPLVSGFHIFCLQSSISTVKRRHVNIQYWDIGCR